MISDKTLREAVDLADGFSNYDSSGLDRIYHRIYHTEWAAHHCYPAIANCPKWATAALASQLREQVDAGEHEVVSSEGHCAIYDQENQVNLIEVNSSYNPDENTINAIVESKVLSND